MTAHQRAAPLPKAGRPGGSPSPQHSESRPSFWRSKGGLVAIAFIAIGAFLLLSEHRVHVLGYWPFLLLLACPLLHVFMHGGHSGHGGHGGHDGHGERPDRPTTPSEGA